MAKRPVQSTSAHLAALSLAIALPLAACGDSGHNDTGGGHPDAAGGNPDAIGGNPDASGTDGAPSDGGVHPDAELPDMGPISRSLIIIHTNDEHSHELGFGPEIDDFPTASPPNHGIEGGIRRRAKKIQELKDEAGLPPLSTSPLLVSAGDMMVGSLFELGDTQGAGVDYNFATLLSYDVITLGNHEFEFGVDALAGAINKGGIDIVQQMTVQLAIPIVASNIRFSLTSTADDALAAFYTPTLATNTLPANKSIGRLLVKTVGSGATAVKVGFLGLMGIDAALSAPFKSPVKFSYAQGSTSCTTDAQCPTHLCLAPATNGAATMGTCATGTSDADPANFGQLVADAAQAVAELRAEGVDIVVAITHVGVNAREVGTIQMTGQIPAQPVSEEILLALGVDQALATNNVKGIDIIVGGHSHTALNTPLVVPNPHSMIKTAIVQAGSYGRYVGKLRLTETSSSTGWVVDTAYSGLVHIDDTISPDGLGVITDMGISGVMQGLIDGVEGQPITGPGDGQIFPGKLCDKGASGQFLPQDGRCQTIVPSATGGMLGCYDNQQLDFTACTFAVSPPAACGNGVVEGREMCDGDTPAGLQNQSCTSLGVLEGGTLTCNPNCTFNLSQCMPHYPSLLEAVLNFVRSGAPVLYQGPGMRGALFFYPLGNTSFDVDAPPLQNESNLLDLVTDAERDALNTIDPNVVASDDPVRVVVNANGVIRDAIKKGQTGVISNEDLFRVLPLGVSPVEKTPGFPLVQFYVSAPELHAALEVGVNQGLLSDSFWLGVSGARVEYDLSRMPFDPANPLDPMKGRITKITLTARTATVGSDLVLEPVALFDVSRATMQNPAAAYLNPLQLCAPGAPCQPIHIGTSLYISLFAEAFGICPRDSSGAQNPLCKSCAAPTDCPVAGTACSSAVGRCVGGPPAGFSERAYGPISLQPLGRQFPLSNYPNGVFNYTQELKEIFALTNYIGTQPNRTIPVAYSAATPRRMCCVGSMCTADRMCPPPRAN
jgi:2',3'-cyclic-nucleotide 2'-phosphodiesterase (5'-nucleotidase family)